MGGDFRIDESLRVVKIELEMVEHGFGVIP